MLLKGSLSRVLAFADEELIVELGVGFEGAIRDVQLLDKLNDLFLILEISG